MTPHPGSTAVLEKLAILGGRPAFAEPVHVGRPNLVDREQYLQRVEEILDRNWLTNNGPVVQEFEDRIARYLGVRNCVAVCNATIGMELAMRATGMKGEVIVPSFTFVAGAHALQRQGIRPVFADIDPSSHQLDPAAVEPLITPETTGIVATHLWGRPCNVAALEALASRRGLRLLFDAAHAFGCTFGGRRVGGFGAAEIFSFHATKFLHSFEGGAITTNDDALAGRLRLMRNFGFEGYDNVVHLGTNGKMTEICAAMGLHNLERVDELIDANRRNHQAYRDALVGVPGIRLYDPALPGEATNHQYVVIEIDDAVAGFGRDDLVRVLHAENVLVRKYFWPGCHQMEPYRTLYPRAGEVLPRTTEVAARVMVLPTGPNLAVADIGRICAAIRAATEQGDLVRAMGGQSGQARIVRATVSTVAQFRAFLGEVAGDFRPPLQDRCNLDQLFSKLFRHGSIVGHMKGDVLTSLLGYYANDRATLTAYMSVLAVSRAERGRGLPGQLLAYAIQAARAAGMTHARLQIEADDRVAQRFYQGYGFVVEDRPPLRTGGILMILKL